MKHLKSYKLFEGVDANKYLKIKEIISTLDDICLELRDEGYTCKIYPSTDIQIKALSLKDVVNAFSNIDFAIGITKKHPTSTFPGDQVFDYKAISPTVDRIMEYMESEGWGSEVESECPERMHGEYDDNSCDYVSIKFNKVPESKNEGIFNFSKKKPKEIPTEFIAELIHRLKSPFIVKGGTKFYKTLDDKLNYKFKGHTIRDDKTHTFEISYNETNYVIMMWRHGDVVSLTLNIGNKDGYRGLDSIGSYEIVNQKVLVSMDNVIKDIFDELSGHSKEVDVEREKSDKVNIFFKNVTEESIIDYLQDIIDMTTEYKIIKERYYYECRFYIDWEDKNMVGGNESYRWFSLNNKSSDIMGVLISTQRRLEEFGVGLRVNFNNEGLKLFIYPIDAQDGVYRLGPRDLSTVRRGL